MEVLRLLFLLSFFFSPISCCDWLRHASRLSEEALKSLKLMGRPLTVTDCPVPFPHRMYSRVQRLQVQPQLFFIKENLRILSDVYLHGNYSLENDNKTTPFLQILEVEIFELNQCVSSEAAKKGVRRFLHRLKKRLKRFKNASWDRLRCETKSQLQRLHFLLVAMEAPAGKF
ncbi:interferon phi 1 [Synchiropus picturatus]